MLHDAGKSIAVSIGFVAEKLEVWGKQCSRKVGLTFFLFFLKMKLVICGCVVCVFLVCWFGWCDKVSYQCWW